MRSGKHHTVERCENAKENTQIIEEKNGFEEKMFGTRICPTGRRFTPAGLYRIHSSKMYGEFAETL